MSDLRPMRHGPPATPPTTTTRRTPLSPAVVVLAGVAALVLVGVAAVAGVVGTRALQGRPASPAAGPGGSTGARGGPVDRVATPGVLDAGASVLSGPGDTWLVAADDLLPGGQVTYLAAGDGPGYPEVLGFPGAAVVQVGTEDTHVLAGLDPADGEVLWQRETDPVLCEPVVDDRLLLCRRGLFDSDGQASYELVDPVSGEVLGTRPGPGGVDGITSDGQSIWVAGTTSRDDRIVVEVSELSATDLGERWSVSVLLPPDVDSLEGSMQLAHHQGRVQVEAYPTVLTVSDAGDDLGTQGDVDDPVTLLGEGYLARQDYDSATTTVVDTDGNTVLVADGYLWTYASCCGSVSQGRVGVGDAMYDLTDGERLWGADEARTDLGDADGQTFSGQWSPDGLHVLLDGSGSTTTLLDAATGEPVWSRPTPGTGASPEWTRDAVASLDGDTVVVTASGGSGDAAWADSASAAVGDPDSEPFDLALADRAVVVAGGDGVQGWTSFSPVGGTGGPTEGGTDYVTACGSEPELVPVESDVAGGGTEITFDVRATCPAGEWWASPTQPVVLRVGSSSSEVLASGTFDMSGSPLWLPGSDDEPVRLRLVFPAGTTYATPTEIARAVSDRVVVVACESAPADRPVPADPSYGTPGTSPRVAVAPADEVDDDESALEALRRIAAEDADAVADLDGSWVPQTSSKIEGTVDDGISYRYSDILEEHLRLRQRYPGVLLVNSDDYASYERAGYWVTLVADPSATPDPALTWCSSRGFDRSHCYAKLLQRDGDPSGSTRQLPR